CLAVAFALFMLPTRVQPRYLFPVVVFAALIAALMPRNRWFYIVLSLTFLANLGWLYNEWHTVIPFRPLYTSPVFGRAVSLVNLGLFLYVLVRALPTSDSDTGFRIEPAATSRASSPP